MSLSALIADADIDIETSELIAKLALQDLEEVYGRRAGKRPADFSGRPGAYTISDEDLAWELQKAQFEEWAGVVQDAKVARSIRDASATDAAYIEALLIAEEAAAEDRRAAEALARDGRLPSPKACQRRLEDKKFVMHPEPSRQAFGRPMPSIFGLAVQDDPLSDDDEETVVPEENQYTIARDIAMNSSLKGQASSSNAGPSKISSGNSSRIDCTICGESTAHASALHTPCGCLYCRTCVRDLVELYNRDESLHPIRCCQQAIPVSSIFLFISLSLRQVFEVKHAEYSVLAKDRIYCSDPTCSAFLGSSVGRESIAEIRCRKWECAVMTCPRCKQAGHPSDPDCAVNSSAVQLRALARQQGWQTCPGCHTIVELNVGCYHMTCRCRAEFCYLCAVPWKNCTCPQWEEQRLLATAQLRVENELGPRAVRNMAEGVMQQRVRARAEELRVNHDCDRHSWRYRHGGGRCEECHFTLPNYLLVCTGCSLLACVRCSRNRF